MNQGRYPEYEPLKWPPELVLAQLHLKCSCPGKDNIEGDECPCCGRYQKFKTRNWYSRDITKDFRTYGGGIPAYFELLTYFGINLLIVILILSAFHIYCLQLVCLDAAAKCVTFLKIIKFCDTNIMVNVLISRGNTSLALALVYLELAAFVYLIIATIGMKWWLLRLNSKKIVKEDKIYSQFSLMIKNVPKFYQIEQVRKQIQQIAPDVQICELFFVHPIAEYETKYKKLFDLHYEIEFVKESMREQTQTDTSPLLKLKETYISLYEEVEEESKKLGQNNGRAIIVFNNVEDMKRVRKQLRINECSKFIFHAMKLIGKNTQKLHFFADKIPQPQEINWKYIGESSVHKTKVRIQTTVIGIGFMVICFMLLYFPIIKVDEESIENPTIGTILGLIISIGIQILAITYRQIILKLIPARHPSSKQSQSYFVVITTVMFHFFFYLIAPATYYLIPTKIPNNVKLYQLFIAVTLFLIMNVLVCFIDLKFRLYNSKRKRILKNWSEWGKLCQIRLHEELTWPSFPIEFKLMVILNIWSFNAFYIFEIPYLLVLFQIVLFIIYWVDKKNIYKHYKMQAFLSIDLQLSIQKHYIIMFLICLCGGYAISAFYTWQYVFIGVMFVVAIVCNQLLSFNFSKKKEQDMIDKHQTLAEMVKSQSINPKQSMRQNLLETQMRDNYIYIDIEESRSLGSVSYSYGYQQIYDNYLHQFKNKTIQNLLKGTYEELRLGISERQSEMATLKIEKTNQGQGEINEQKVNVSREEVKEVVNDEEQAKPQQ